MPHNYLTLNLNSLSLASMYEFSTHAKKLHPWTNVWRALKEAVHTVFNDNFNRSHQDISKTKGSQQ